MAGSGGIKASGSSGGKHSWLGSEATVETKKNSKGDAVISGGTDSSGEKQDAEQTHKDRKDRRDRDGRGDDGMDFFR